ncbi:MAG: hypothetical protein ACE5JN_13720 [Candidatus Methylomirabilia bacterium]
MWVIPIRMDPVETHIHADRRLAFQVLTAFGATQPDGGSSRVLREEGGRKLVEFHTAMPTSTGGKKVYRTVEWVTLHDPEAIDFQGVEGPLDLLRDRFVLEDVGGCTAFRYESTFGMKGWIFGWLVGRFRVKPILGRFMREHTRELKETIEERAKRSRIFPYRDCGTTAE